MKKHIPLEKRKKIKKEAFLILEKKKTSKSLFFAYFIYVIYILFQLTFYWTL